MPYYTYTRDSKGRMYTIRHHGSEPPKPQRPITPSPPPQAYSRPISEPVRTSTNPGLDQQARVVNYEDFPGKYAQPGQDFNFPKPYHRSAAQSNGAERSGSRIAELYQTNSGETVRVRSAAPHHTSKVDNVGRERLRSAASCNAPMGGNVGNARIRTVGPSELRRVDSLPGQVRVQTVAPSEPRKGEHMEDVWVKTVLPKRKQ